ncbi:MAG: hypothetical protein HYT79_01155 [Elusimicrobia bacterium]|nr:hypothetical protein [Elusimicrobiota bacterium]
MKARIIPAAIALIYFVPIDIQAQENETLKQRQQLEQIMDGGAGQGRQAGPVPVSNRREERIAKLRRLHELYEMKLETTELKNRAQRNVERADEKSRKLIGPEIGTDAMGWLLAGLSLLSMVPGWWIAASILGVLSAASFASARLINQAKHSAKQEVEYQRFVVRSHEKQLNKIEEDILSVEEELLPNS